MMLRAILLAVLVVAGGCGRTTLDDFSDGGAPPFADASRPDAGSACRGDADCDDGVFCNGPERCSAGRCVAGTPVGCDDGVACTEDACDEGARACQSVPDHSRCGPDSLCTPRGCDVVRCEIDRDCQDGFACNGREQCRRGTCATGSPLRCDDGVPCTRDRCRESAGGCVHSPDHDRCDDGLFCTGDEVCDARRGCRSTMPVFCDDGDPCTVDFCDEPSRSCVSDIIDPMCLSECPLVSIGPAFGPAVFAAETIGLPDSFAGSCGGERSPEMTIEWIAPFGAFWTFSTFGSDYDTVLYVMATCGGPELACNDDAAGVDSEVSTFVPGGASVIIVVDGFRGRSGFFQLGIFPDMVGFEICNDGDDNDGDGAVDCMDSDCFGDPFCVDPCAPFEFNCFDGLDEDCDMRFDCEDSDCAFVPGCMMCAPRERSRLDCSDGRDNDCDMLPDCADPECQPFGPGTECCNGVDDDGDGEVDLFTCLCSTDAECVGIGSLEQVCWSSLFGVCAPNCVIAGGDAFCTAIDPTLRCRIRDGECVP